MNNKLVVFPILHKFTLNRFLDAESGADERDDDDDEPIGDGGSFRSHAPQWRAALPAILQSGGGGGLSAQIGALQQSWRANPPADFARTELWEGAVAVRYAHLAATAINMRTGGGIWSFVGLSECRGPTLYPTPCSIPVKAL